MNVAQAEGCTEVTLPQRSTRVGRKAQRPELQIVRLSDGAVASAEQLPVVGYEHLTVCDYALVSSYSQQPAVCLHATWRRSDPRLEGIPLSFVYAPSRDLCASVSPK